jgi:hypothetical protein
MNNHKDRKDFKDRPQQPAGTSGYPEPQPTPRHQGSNMPDANTPHEPQNVPERKPKPST